MFKLPFVIILITLKSRNTFVGQQEWCTRPRKLQKTTVKWYGHERRMKEEHNNIVRRMPDVDIPGKEEDGGHNYGGKMHARET